MDESDPIALLVSLACVSSLNSSAALSVSNASSARGCFSCPSCTRLQRSASMSSSSLPESRLVLARPSFVLFLSLLRFPIKISRLFLNHVDTPFHHPYSTIHPSFRPTLHGGIVIPITISSAIPSRISSGFIPTANSSQLDIPL